MKNPFKAMTVMSDRDFMIFVGKIFIEILIIVFVARIISAIWISANTKPY